MCLRTNKWIDPLVNGPVFVCLVMFFFLFRLNSMETYFNHLWWNFTRKFIRIHTHTLRKQFIHLLESKHNTSHNDENKNHFTHVLSSKVRHTRTIAANWKIYIKEKHDMNAGCFASVWTKNEWKKCEGTTREKKKNMKKKTFNSNNYFR